MSNINGREGAVSRGNLSYTTINLPMLALDCGKDLEKFNKKLVETIELVKDQLLERFEYQCNRPSKQFSFLLGQDLYLDSDKVSPHNIREALKHGTLSIGFVGLAETLMLLIGEHHGQSKSAQELGLKIVKTIRDLTDKYTEEYKLNFSTFASPAENLVYKACTMVRNKYGVIEGITDKEYLTNSNHVPVWYDISMREKIAIEAPYHQLCNGGNITYIEAPGDIGNNLEAFEQILRMMKEAGVGYGAINIPIDRCPVCGYTGIINDTCPACGRAENEFPSLETLTALQKKGHNVPANMMALVQEEENEK